MDVDMILYEETNNIDYYIAPTVTTSDFNNFVNPNEEYWTKRGFGFNDTWLL